MNQDNKLSRDVRSQTCQHTEPPLFSIITVTLNCREALEKTLESIDQQSFRDFEHIIKDGGSTDGTLDFLHTPRVDARTVVVTAKDKGIYDAMNHALETATGEYFLFLNAGDLLATPESLHDVAAACRSNGLPDLVYTDYQTDTNQIMRNPSAPGRFFFFRTMICHQVCYVRRHCFDRLGKFDIRLKILADYDFLLRLVLSGTMSFHHIPVITCIFDTGGASSLPSNRNLHAFEIHAVRRRHFRKWERIIYGGIIMMTLPSLRNRIVRDYRGTAIAKIYQYFVNRMYAKTS